MEREFDPFKVNSYTKEELMEFLTSKTVEFEDLQQSGLNYKMQNEIREFIAKGKEQEEKEAREWKMVSRGKTLEDYLLYLDNWKDNPYGIHVDDAEWEIEKIRRQSEGLKRALLEDMKMNPWRYRQEEMRNLFNGIDLSNEGVCEFLEEQDDPMSRFLLTGSKLSFADLVDSGVVPADIKKSDIMAVDYQMPATQVKDMGEFPSERTDVYFLGVPRSGKSSVLAGIIYTLWKKGLAGYEPSLVDGKDPSQGYYQGLIRAISTKKPPQGTAIDTVSFMKLNIRNNRENRRNPVTMVEISGESFRQLALKHTLGADAWKQLGATKCISNNNRKCLFFVLDYSVISEKNLNGDTRAIDQQMALESSLDVFLCDGPNPKDPSRGCTMSKVDTVAIIMTKSDLMDVDTQEERLDVAEDYIRDNFLNFMNNLQDNCKKFGINKANSNRPYILAFSLGRFTVGNTVLYNSTDSDAIIDFISHATRGTNDGIFGSLSSWFK